MRMQNMLFTDDFGINTLDLIHLHVYLFQLTLSQQDVL